MSEFGKCPHCGSTDVGTNTFRIGCYTCGKEEEHTLDGEDAVAVGPARAAQYSDDVFRKWQYEIVDYPWL